MDAIIEAIRFSSGVFIIPVILNITLKKCLKNYRTNIIGEDTKKILVVVINASTFLFISFICTMLQFVSEYEIYYSILSSYCVVSTLIYINLCGMQILKKSRN